jgi:hypothetical protein
MILGGTCRLAVVVRGISPTEGLKHCWDYVGVKHLSISSEIETSETAPVRAPHQGCKGRSISSEIEASVRTPDCMRTARLRLKHPPLVTTYPQSATMPMLNPRKIWGELRTATGYCDGFVFG